MKKETVIYRCLNGGGICIREDCLELPSHISHEEGNETNPYLGIGMRSPFFSKKKKKQTFPKVISGRVSTLKSLVCSTSLESLFHRENYCIGFLVERKDRIILLCQRTCMSFE